MKVGVIGLGIMGKPIARNLLKANCKIYVNDIKEDVLKELEKEGAVISDYKTIGENCELVLLSLPNGDIVKSTVLGENGLINFLKEKSVVCDTSSITPIQSKEIYKKLKEKNIGFLDAPVSGGEEGAIAGSLAIMVGGDKSDFDKVAPVFDIIGNSKILVGDSGSGSATKLINQIIVNLNIATISEAYMLGEKLGVNLEKVYEAIKGGLAGSAVLDQKTHRILEKDFEPGGKISINYKDINNVMSTAHEINCPLFLTANLQQIMAYLVQSGNENLDHAGIYKYFENLTGREE
ncbi:MAG: NAD(P)-binding domain-containing protein [Peptoniphilaceae bacterium]|uniref:NAD(P)-binding domain-containing protein n=1 Tax=Anaerococcus sp. AGMB09787 TaxID=2922869 RepID=UPI001FB03A76|nr:NAD(P)-binding domain-containing protein [Anaerococcus sp. AGMB09787]MDD7044389.1 NAD(P)-binding domain-containing protein [Peptoniphilaceae bacterium]